MERGFFNQMSKSRFSHRSRRQRSSSIGLGYQQLEKREVLTSLTGQPCVETDTPVSHLATIYLNPETKVLFIHAGIENPNLPGFESDVLVSLRGNDGDIVVEQVAGSAGAFRNIPENLVIAFTTNNAVLSTTAN